MIAAVIDAVIHRLGKPKDLEGRAQLARFWDRRTFLAGLKAKEQKAAVGRIEQIAIRAHKETCEVCRAMSVCDVLQTMIFDIQNEAREL